MQTEYGHVGVCSASSNGRDAALKGAQMGLQGLGAEQCTELSEAAWAAKDLGAPSARLHWDERLIGQPLSSARQASRESCS